MIALNLSLELWMHERTPENRARVIEEHRYLCGRAARKFLRDGLERADLEQVAAIGLIKAVDRFDPACETPFDGYAWVLILGELMHFVRDHERLMRAPRRVRELERRWSSAERELATLLGREPKSAEIARYIGASARDEADIHAYRNSSSVLSMDALRLPETRNLAYTMEPHVDRMALESSMATLTDSERRVLTEIYQHGTPIGEVAQRMGYSRRHVSRLHRSALEKLQADEVSQHLAGGALLSLARLS